MSDQAERKCQRHRAVGGGWECQRCALAWDEADVWPECSPVTYERLIDAGLAEAARLEASQRALTAGDQPVRKFRDQGQLQRAQELRALVRVAVKMRDMRQ